MSSPTFDVLSAASVAACAMSGGALACHILCRREFSSSARQPKVMTSTATRMRANEASDELLAEDEVRVCTAVRVTNISAV